MLPLEKCKHILNGNSSNQKYTDEEIKLIREILTHWASLNIKILKQKDQDEESRHHVSS